LQVEALQVQAAQRSPMLYAVLFEDNASLGADVRRQHMPAHLSFLEKNATQIKAAGRYERRQAILQVGCGSLKPIAQTWSTRS
jgi:hypothetical protein